MAKENYFNDSFKTLGSILIVVLPLMQFGFISLPESISGLYVGKETFFFTSFITLFFSLFLIFAHRRNPFFRIILNKKKQKSYLEYLEKRRQKQSSAQSTVEPIKVINPPFAITPGWITFLSVVLFLGTGMGFIWIGINFTSATLNPSLSFLQSILYILMFSSGIYALVYFTYGEFRTKQWKKIKEERIQQAINLAIENKAFESIPQINFIALEERTTSVPMQLIVEVRIGDRRYDIITNQDADELIAVYEIKES